MDPAPPSEPDVEDEKPRASSARAPRAQPPLALLGVIALLVGLLGGFIAGFRVEQNRIWTRNTKSQAPILKQVSQKISRVGGVVTAAANGKITVDATTGFQVRMDLPSTLVVDRVIRRSIADIAVGSRILQRGEQVSVRRGNRSLSAGQTSGNVDASEIIVVPRGSKFKGARVTAVNGNKIRLVQLNGQLLAITVQPTTAIYTLQRSSTNAIVKGSEVLANGRGALGVEKFEANAIIILARGSAFAQQ